MNVKNFYCMMAIGASLFCLTNEAKAQDAIVEEGVSVTEFNCDNTTRYYQSWKNNWFIQLGAGVNQPFVERGGGSQKLVNRKDMTAVYNVGVGHWFSPYLAMRINALGGTNHWNSESGRGYVSGRHVNLNAELMWDMCNSIAGVNPNRVFSVIPYVGIGGDYMWNINHNGERAGNMIGDNGRIRKSEWTLPVSAGIQFRLRLCKAVDFFAEARAAFYGDNWNNTSYGRPIDAEVACLGGFDININGREWGSYNECQSLAKLADMNNEVNLLRAENLAQAQQIAALESQPKAVEEVIVEKDCPEVPLMATVRFKINSDKIMPTEEVNLYNMAQWMKANPDQKVTICGYADKDTGTSAYNMQLSKKRAEAVCNALVKKYGISSDRLSVKYDGSDVQPYGTNDWNRIVIFSDK